MSTVDPRLLQRYLRESARLRSQTARVAPYTAFFSPDSHDPFLNYAIPDEPTTGRHIPVMQADAKGLGAVPDDDPEYALVRLKEAFRARRRKARVEYVEEAAPDLGPLLRAAGFASHKPTPLLCCTRATWTQAPAPTGLRIDPIVPTTPWGATRAYLQVQREAFGIEAADIPQKAPPNIWPTLGIAAGLVASQEMLPIAAGGFTPPIEGVAELTGLSVLPAHRGQGLSDFLASSLAKVALETGAEVVLLLGSDEGARTGGAPPGFEACATLADWREA